MSVGGRHIVLAQFRVPGRRDAGSFNDVLQRVRDAVQRPAPPAGHQLAVSGCRLGQCDFRRHADKAVQFAVVRGDAIEQRLRHFRRRQFTLVV
jgi:hypothetical protein